MSTKLDGAQAVIDGERTSIDLAWLASQLRRALDTVSTEDASIFKVSKKNGNVLIADTRPVIARLMSHGDFARDAEHRFLKGIEVPAPGKALKIGGRIRPGTESSLKQEIAAMKYAIDGKLAEAFNHASVSPSELWIVEQAVRGHFVQVGKELGSTFQPEATANIGSLRFEDANASAAGSMIARQITSFEAVEEGNRLEQIMQAASRYFLRKRYDQEDVAEDVEAWKEQGSRPGSFVDGLINFLDDEGLSRVRVAVSFRIMTALAEAAEAEGLGREFVRYVRRLSSLFHRLVETRESSCIVDLVSLFGQSGEVDVAEHLAKASFCRGLPVWSIWEAQLFESHSKRAGDSGVKREVCYHFRANGYNPQEKASTFISRIKFAADVLQADRSPSSSRRSLAELLIYDAVLRAEDIDPMSAIEQRVLMMKNRPDRAAALAELRSDLEARENLVNNIARQMVDVLKRARSAKRIAAATAEPISFFVNVTDGVLNKGAVGAGTSHPFAECAEGEPRNVAWLKNLRVTSGAVNAAGNDFFSFKIVVQIGDRSLVRHRDPVTVATSRLMKGRVALMNLLPFPEQTTDQVERLLSSLNDLSVTWRRGQGSTVILYDPSHISGKGRNGNRTRSDHAALVAARTAVMLLLQIVGDRIVEAMSASSSDDRLILYRHQLYGKRPNDSEGWTFSSEAIFTISQALEHALGKRLTVKLQGTVAGDKTASDVRRKRRKSFDAVTSAFDLKMSGVPGTGFKKVGVVSFASRPCDTDESRPPNDRDTHLVLGRSYLFEPVADGCVIRRRTNLLDTYEGSEAVTSPSVVKEAVRGLVAEGCTHIVMLAHKYSGRSIGRSAARHRHHENVSFLTELGKSFPDVVFHPVAKDSMKVVRLSDERSRIGFELFGREAHAMRLVGSDMKESFNSEGLIPFYSLATLHVVNIGSDKGMRTQSGIMTYYLLNPDNADGLTIRIGNTSLMTTGSPEHASVAAALRGIHMLESEEGAMGRVIKPVLEPSSWMKPADINGAGEIKALPPTRTRSGTVEISMTAVGAIVSRVLGSVGAVHGAGK